MTFTAPTLQEVRQKFFAYLDANPTQLAMRVSVTHGIDGYVITATFQDWNDD